MARTPSKRDRLKALLQKGYLPEELPPPFMADGFAKFASSLKAAWGPPQSFPATEYEVFSFPRVGHSRRNLAILNPVSYLGLADAIAENWVEIRQFLKSSRLSKSIPYFSHANRRALQISSYDDIELQRILISSQHNHVLVTDIARFYGSIYTHAIPWALYGKSWSKQHMHTPNFKSTLGNTLDVLSRKCQQNQTIGLPVGPDSSKVLAEIISVGIDRRFQDPLLLESRNSYRYVDDFFIGRDQHSDSEVALHQISRALLGFELEINNEKTHLLPTAECTEADWPYELRRFQFGRSVPMQHRRLEEYFHRAFYLARQHPFENVLEYAVKRTRSESIFRRNWPLYEAFIMKVLRVNASSIRTVVQLLVNANNRGQPINRARIEKLVCDSIRYLAPLGRHGEVAWMLFLAKALRLRIPSDIADMLTELESSVCALLTLDLRERGLVKRRLDMDLWMAALQPDGLKGRLWPIFDSRRPESSDFGR